MKVLPKSDVTQWWYAGPANRIFSGWSAWKYRSRMPAMSPPAPSSSVSAPVAGSKSMACHNCPGHAASGCHEHVLAGSKSMVRHRLSRACSFQVS